MDAIRRLVSIIRDLQKQNHAIVLMLDANQTLKECYKGSSVKRYSIEWLRM
jgi:hypothetical protein